VEISGAANGKSDAKSAVHLGCLDNLLYPLYTPPNVLEGVHEQGEEEEMSDEMTPDVRFIDAWLSRTGSFLERVMVFIDAEYWRKCLQDQFHRVDVDLNKVVQKLVGGRRLVRTYYYTAEIKKPPDDHWREQQKQQQRFITALAYQPYIELRLGRLQFGENGYARQKGVDVLLALDMLRFALKDNYDVAVLVTGDGDFADIVRMVKDEGRIVEIVTFPGTRAAALQEACDICVEVTPELLAGCWMKEPEN